MGKLWIPFVMVTTALHAGTPQKIDLSTLPPNVGNWTVWEVSNGQLVSATALKAGKTYGNIKAITFPFTDNDGFWYADITFVCPRVRKGLRCASIRWGWMTAPSYSSTATM